jgi:crossover junction endodeoxyribonuclease RuvC
MIVLGIDIGVTGAIAILQDGELVNVHDMPCLDDGPVKRRNINAPLLASIIYSTHAELAYVEHVSARPKEGPTGAFAFGRSRGVIEGVLAAAGVPVQFLTPVSWKRLTGVPPGTDKDAARSKAIARWPGKAELFRRKLDHNRAEAALIGLAGIKRDKEETTWRRTSPA